jgi:hypothetical protein
MTIRKGEDTENFEEEALYRIIRRNLLGRSYRPDVKIDYGMNEWMNE